MTDAVRATQGDVLELRVHGVSGTPPEDLLDRPLVEQVAGDRIAGFWRPWLPAERRDASPDPFAPPQPGAPDLRSYNWGGLTSGTATRALWLLLLPMTLVNVAPRARPDGPDPSAPAVRWLWYFSRLLALAVTCLYVVTWVGLGMDLVSWQCSTGRICAGANPDFVFHDISFENRFSIEHMLLIGAAVPLLLLLLIGFVAQRTANRYEKTIVEFGEVATRTSASGKRRRPAEQSLSSPDMWRNEVPVGRLRALHLQAGVALVLWSVAATTEWSWWSIGPPLVVLVHAVVAPAFDAFTSHARSVAWTRVKWAAWGLLGLGGAGQVLGLAVAHRWVSDTWLHDVDRASASADPDATGFVHRTPMHGLPYYPQTVLTVCAVAAGALLALAVTVVWAARTKPATHTGVHRPTPATLLRCSTSVFAALGTFLAASLSAGVYMYVATWLDTGQVKPGYGQIGQAYVHFVVPGAVASANVAYAFAAAAAVVLVLISAAVVGWRYVRSPRGTAYFRADYGSKAGRGERARVVEIRRAMFLARVVDHAPRLIGALVLAGGGIVAWLGVRLILDGGLAPTNVIGSIDTGWRSAAAIGSAGTYLAVFTVIGLVAFGGLAYRVPKWRRSVGILWDVAAFWPRMCHPLAAPCYAERTVPDLVTYVSAYRARHPDNGVVLAAHSQGTVISAAVIRQLATGDEVSDRDIAVTPRLAFLSFGCVLRRLYGRFFPAYFGPAQLHALEGALTGDADADDAPRWINLWRYTDYLGGQVTAGPPQVLASRRPGDDATAPLVGPVAWEWHSPDPVSVARLDGDTTYSQPGRHSDFWSDASGYFQLAVADLADRVRSDPNHPDDVKESDAQTTRLPGRERVPASPRPHVHP